MNIFVFVILDAEFVGCHKFASWPEAYAFQEGVHMVGGDAWISPTTHEDMTGSGLYVDLDPEYIRELFDQCLHAMDILEKTNLSNHFVDADGELIPVMCLR